MVPRGDAIAMGRGPRRAAVKSQEGEKGGRGCEKEKPGSGRKGGERKEGGHEEGESSGKEGELGPGGGSQAGSREGSCSEKRQRAEQLEVARHGEKDRLDEEQERGQNVEVVGVFRKDEVERSQDELGMKEERGSQRKTEGDVPGKNQRKCWSTVLDFLKSWSLRK